MHERLPRSRGLFASGDARCTEDCKLLSKNLRVPTPRQAALKSNAFPPIILFFHGHADKTGYAQFEESCNKPPLSLTPLHMNLFRRLLATDNTISTLCLRLALGIVFFPHGAGKMFPVFGGEGFSGTLHGMSQGMDIPVV